MFSSVYVSSSSKPLSRDELLELLAKVRANNTALGVTGLLLYKDGNFMQVLEGDEKVVRDLQLKIARDLRHHGMLVLLQQHQPDREFGGWSMAFRDLGHLDSEKADGYSEFMNVDFADRNFVNDVSRIQKLLSTFRKTLS